MVRSKSAEKIPIETIYGLLMYAYEDLWDETIEDEPNVFDSLDDLLSELLLRGIERQLKRGLYKTYVRYEEPVTIIRGKIDMHSSIKLKTQLSRQLYCEYDEFDKDNFYNQVLKATCLYVLRRGKVGQHKRKRIKDLLYQFNDISEIILSAVTWESIAFHKDKFAYRSLIGICYLIYKGVLENEETEKTYLSPVNMSDLYTRFLRHFYMREFPEFRIGYQGKTLGDAENMLSMKNELEVDMTLTYGKKQCILNSHYNTDLIEESLVADSKGAMMSQIRRTLKSVQKENLIGEHEVYGAFLYPSVETNYLEADPLEGNEFYCGAINLTLPFAILKEEYRQIGQILKEMATTR